MTDAAPKAGAVLGVERSILGRRWVARADESDIRQLESGAGLDFLRASLLAGRGVEPDQAAQYLSPSLSQDLPDPSNLADMDRAAGLILDAIEGGAKITLFSDYDVDGGTSAAQMIRWGRGVGYDFRLFVPDRIRDGYGPSPQALSAIKETGADLVVTLDCGAAAHEALHAAADMDLPIIVVDHHLMDGSVPAQAIVNPNRPDDTSGLGHLAAAGVTFLLVVALQREARRRSLSSTLDIRELLGLTALGTVCDVVPMIGLNRTLVRQGLKVMNQQRLAGLNALAGVSRATAPFSTYHAGFVLGPRINAGGRIGRSEMGAELLATDDIALATAHAQELDRLNIERRAMQDHMLSEALEMADRQSNRAVVTVAMEGWHPGVIGIVAGRLKDRLDRPAVVIGVDEDGVGKGSGRSISGVNLGEAFFAAKADGVILSGGGHAMAGGLTVARDKIDALSDYLDDRLGAAVGAARANPVTKIDAVLSPNAVTTSLTDAVESVGPYGPQNPTPRFAVSDVRVAYASRLKGGHVRFSAEGRGGDRVGGILFRGDETDLGSALLEAGDRRMHILGQVKLDRWQGREKVDFHLSDAAFIG